MIVENGRERTAGFAMPNGFWFRRMDGEKHFWRDGSIGASVAALAEAVRLGCVACKVLDSRTNDTYLVTVEDLRRYSRPVQRPGWEPQLALARKYWTLIHHDGTVEPSLQERPAQPAEPEAAQMSLFGGA